MDRVKIALVGVGNRGRNTYLPIIQTLSRDLEFVAVADARAEAAEEAGRFAEVPWYTDLEKMVSETRPDVCAVVTTSSRHHQVGVPLAQMGVSYAVETPIDSSLDRADEMIAAARENGTKIEVAENYYRVPIERIKRQMILEGVFGKILTAYNDFRGHGYHGVGLIRSYIGFEVKAKRAFGFVRTHAVQPHYYRGRNPKEENWQHGVIEFENGGVGVFNFSSLSYGSPLRRYNTSKFFGERGFCVKEEASILDKSASERRLIKISRRTHTVEGRETLAAMEVDTPTPVVWENPLRDYPLSEGQISVASEIMSIANAVRDGTEPEYGALNGRADREIDLAMARSWDSGGAAVELPL